MISRMKCGALGTLAFAILMVTLTMVPSACRAQTDPIGSKLTDKRVTLNLENADLRYALKLLFNSVGANFTLDAFAQGTVTVALRDVPFKTALESLLRSTSTQNPLTYRVEDGVYYITVKKDETIVEVDPITEAPVPPKSRITKIQLNYVSIDDLLNAGLIFGVIRTGSQYQ